MEHTTRRPRSGALLTVLCVLAVMVPLAPPALANHGEATLNVRPESASPPLGSTHTMTAELSRLVTVEQGSINIDFENQNGVNDDDGTTLDSPDLTCTIPSGERSCSVSYTGSITGRDLWRGWIDHDGRDATVEADRTEGRNEYRNAGGGGTNSQGAAADGEPDCTDAVEVLWGTGSLDCDDAEGPDTERNTNPSGGGAVSNEVYTCRLTSTTGRPDADVVVKAEVTNGINDPDVADGASYESPDYRCTTGDGTQGSAVGECTITVTQNEAEAGTAVICFWVGTPEEGQALCADEETGESQETDETQEGAGSDIGNDLADVVEKTWETRRAAGLDAEPETATSGFGTHEVTATVYDQFGAPFNGSTTVNLEFFRGSPSDTDRGTPATPDLTCTTVNDATCTVTYSQSAVPGTDLMCVWIGTAPTFSGTNNNGTCDGEGLSDADDTAGSPDRAEPFDDDVDVVQKIWQNPTAATTLDCVPERGTARRNTSPVITCSATDSSGIAVAGAEIDAEATGVNDPDAADAAFQPDFSCVTGATGRCSFTHGPRGIGTTDLQGVTTYRAWIDADNDNSTTEADTAEGLDEVTAPGAAEPDNTDVVQITFGSVRCDIAGTAGGETLRGTGKSEVICGLAGNDRIFGGGGNDRIFADKGSDFVQANEGSDVIQGAAGNDTLRGGKGDDRLEGQSGNDSLFGEAGRDRCNGGPGRDRRSSC